MTLLPCSHFPLPNQAWVRWVWAGFSLAPCPTVTKLSWIKLPCVSPASSLLPIPTATAWLGLYFPPG